MFIVFEGIDGSGKTTQIKLLKRYLINRNKTALLTVEPQKTNIGKLIKQIICSNNTPKEAIALLFAADRMDHIKNILIPNLPKFDFILSDRYFLSSFVYQSLHGCDEDWLKQINKYIIEPNLIILLDVDVNIFLKRRGENKVIYENIAFQKKARQKYLEFAKKLNNVVVIDGNKSVWDVHKEIINVVKNNLSV